MRTDDKITFKLRIQEYANEVYQEYVVHPVYEAASLKFSRPDGKMYYKKEIAGTFSFVGGECWLIHQQLLTTKFTLIIYDRGEEVARGAFKKTDCETDLNSEVVSVDLASDDMYSELEGDNSEYNMIKWGLDKYEMGVMVRPSIQIYSLYDTIVHSYSGSGHTDLQLNYENPTALELTDTMHFAKKTYGAFYIGNDISVVGATGRYLPTGPFNESTINCYMVNGVYTIAIHKQADDEYVITLRAGDETIYNMYWQDASYFANYTFTYDKIINSQSVYAETVDFHNQIEVRCNFWQFFGREVGDHRTMTYTIPENDITTSNNKKCLPFPPSAIFSTNVDDNGNCLPPSNIGTWYELDRGSWFNGISVWMEGLHYENAYNAIAMFRSPIIIIRDWYLLGDVIKGLLAQIDDTLTFEADTDHSEFLFSNINPITNEAQYPIFVTQKSNLLNINYQYPAWSALITWNRMETMLRTLFNCYYDIYIDEYGNKHFRIEHYQFYANGYSYDDNPATIVNLNEIYEPVTRKPYSFHTKSWKYDTERPYSRWEFGWMDKQSEPFEAFPIEVARSEKIYTRNTIDERITDWFSADIDFMLSVSGETSSDGFVIAMSDGGGDGNRSVCQGNVQIGSTTYYCQNNRMALGYLQSRFHLYGIYSQHVTMNNTDDLVDVLSRKKMRLQEIECSLPMDKLRPENFYTTEVGDGEVESMEIDLSDNAATITLKQSTEEL